MPELPEVEIARRNLTRWLRRARLTEGAASVSRVLTGTPAAFRRAVRGRTVAEVTRRGKWLRLELGEGWLLFSHLGMTGKWVRRHPDEPTQRWERARLDGVRRGAVSSVRYLDPRLFGRLLVARQDIPAWQSLGPDPLVDGLTPSVLGDRLRGRRRPIKDALMDQTVLAGIGNIQATEALWLARVDPRSPAAALSARDVTALVAGIKTTLHRTLGDEDTPEITYLHEADATNPFLIYGRGGEPCPRCRRPLTRMVLGGRTTTYCGKCQVRRS